MESTYLRDKVPTCFMDESVYRYLENLQHDTGETISALIERIVRGHMEASKAAANG